MKNFKIRLNMTLPLACGILLSTMLFSQNTSADVLSANIKAACINDSTAMLRWVPANYKTWKWGIDSGYALQRMTIAHNDTILSPNDMNASIISIDFIPKSQAQWEYAIQNDSFVGVAAAASFGEHFSVNNSNANDIFSIYDINSERENRFSLSLFAADMSTLAAGMQNLYYLDTQVIYGNRYTYLIKPRGNHGNNLLKPGVVSLLIEEPEVMPTPLPPIVKSGDSLIYLTWDHGAVSEHYSSYNIFISTDSGYTYTMVNKTPIAPVSNSNDSEEVMYYCSIPNNLIVYCFKIQGHSPFGIDGPLSNPVCISGTPTPLNTPIWIDSLSEDETGITVMWEFPNIMNNRILGFNVLRAPSHGGEFIKINTVLINPDDRIFIDIAPPPISYYKIEYIDIYSNANSSLPKIYQIKDSIPPVAPLHVSGTSISDDGVIRIQWAPSTSPDVMGYRVFMSDQPGGLFGQITSKWVSDTIYLHKINTYTLAEKKYYKIKAIDFRENSSDFSSTCIVDIPDNISPSKPTILDIENGQGSIIVRFNPSLSNDIERHQILRRQKGHMEWSIIAVFDSTLFEKVSYIDTTVDYETTYEYVVQSVDDAMNKSNSNVFNMANNSEVLPAPTGLNLKYNKQENCIEIFWEYHNYHKINCFVIYRGLHPDTLRECVSITPEKVLFGGLYNGPAPFAQEQTTVTGYQIAEITPNLQQAGTNGTKNVILCRYKDKEHQRFLTYYYAVGVKYEDGSQSMRSTPIPISAY